MKNDLTRTRDYLQAIIQEHETTNEELKAANEEAQSSMEELHSTNEELETAKEELQSTNEELVTLNEQLQKRNTELARLSDELSNVLTGVDIPILILGADLHIRRFTPQAEKLLRLLPGDIGRPLSHIRIGVNLPDLDESISAGQQGSTRCMARGQGRRRPLVFRPHPSVPDGGPQDRWRLDRVRGCERPEANP